MGMKSYEVFQELTDAGCNNDIMAKTGLKKSQVSRWSQPGDVSNPLERAGQLADASAGKTDAVQRWLGERLDCTLVPNPKPVAPAPDLRAAATDVSVQVIDLAKLIILVAARKPISREDAARLRRLWERVKARVEGFIRACEQSSFRFLAVLYPLLHLSATGELVPVLAEA